MSRPISLRERWWRWRRRRLDRRMTEEFAFHLEAEQKRLEALGRPPRQARREALERFGDPAAIADLCRIAALDPQPPPQGGDTMSWLHDTRQAARGLARQPGFLIVLVLTAAIGIGATTAVFSVVHSVVLNPLPYAEPDRLVRIYTADQERPELRNYLPAPDFVDYRERVDAFAATGAFYDYRETGLDLTGLGPPRRVRALAVSGGYFDVLGATPLHGRLLRQEEEAATEGRYGARVVVLSHHLWWELSGGDPSIVGQTLQLNGEAHTVAGVLRPSFLDVLNGEIDLWMPVNLGPEGTWNHRRNYYLSAIARLAPGVSVATAQAQADSVLERIRVENPEERDSELIQVLPLYGDVLGSTPSMLFILLGASLLVLLIAVVNVANLLVARGLGRRRELAVRAALGSGRLRLARQLLLESGLAAAIGGGLGIALAYGGVRALLAVSPESLARSEEVSFDPQLLLFCLGLIGLTTLLFGLAPAYQAARVDPGDALRGGARGGDTNRKGRRLRMGLVVSQIALAAMLLIGAGVLIRSFTALHRVPLKIDSDQVLTFEVHLPDSRYGEGQQRVDFHQRYQERLRRLPGVLGAGAISKLPALGIFNVWGTAWTNAQGEEEWIVAEARVVEGDYFEVLGIPLFRGRLPTALDGAEQQPVVVVNQALVDQIWPGEDVIGREIRPPGGPRTIIGVVTDVPHDHLGSIRPKFYIPHGQFGDNRNWALSQVVKAQGDPRAVIEAARAELAEMDAQLVLHRPTPFAELLGRQRASQRFAMLLMMIFAAGALGLAVVGIYGVLAYSVAQQRRELGIRVALGARPGQMLRAVLGQGFALTLLGLAFGLPAAWASSRLLESLLFEASAQDLGVFGCVGLGLLGTALLAALAPACQALRTDPIQALRED